MMAAGADTQETRPRFGQRADDRDLSIAVVIYFLTLALPMHFYAGSVFMTGARVVLLVTVIPLSIGLFSGRYGRIIPADILLLSYAIWNIATLYINSPDQAISFGGSYALEVYGSYLLARACIRTPRQFKAACNGLFAVFLFSFPFAVYETQTGVAPVIRTIEKLPGIFSFPDFFHPTEGIRLGLERSQVLFAHPIHYGVFCASLFSLAVIGYRGTISFFRRWLLGALIFMGLIASVSSGAITPMILQLVMIGWAWAFDRVTSRWLILTGLVMVLYVTVDLLSNRTPVQVFLEYGTLSSGTAFGRLLIFEWGMDNVWKNPWVGIGLNSWERPWWKISESMDNFWLLVAVRYGIPGFALLIVAYASVLWRVMWRDVGTEGQVWQFRRAWAITQVALFMALCTVDVWATMLSYIFFLFGMGVWFLSAEPEAAQAERGGDGAGLPPPRAAPGAYSRFPVRMRPRQVGPDRAAR